jgi:hypothetical protein
MNHGKLNALKTYVSPVALLVWGALASPGFAQTSEGARLVVSVVDSSGAVLRAATVSVTCEGQATKAKTASDRGVVIFEGLSPATCTLEGVFPGLGTMVLRGVRVKSGENAQVLVLHPKPVTETVTVEGNRQTAAADRATLFGSVLTREQIDALSDDLNEMTRQLLGMAGPDAVIRVDGFEGAPLPPKAQIKSIHIQRDQFAAENHAAGATFIDIITQVGVGPLRFNITGLGFQNSALDGRNALMPEKAPSRTTNYGFNLSGALAKERSSFSLSVNGLTAFTEPNLYASSATGQTIAQVADLKVPTHTVSVAGLFDYAITRDQTLRIGYTQNSVNSANLGVGGFNLPERAYSSDNETYNLRIHEAGPIGRRFFMNTRLAVTTTDASAQSALRAQTIQVSDAFTSGGAQIDGGSRTRTLDLQSDVDYVRGRHSLRTGVQISEMWYHSTADTNYLGTYTFTSLAAFNADTPALFTQHIGNPVITDVDGTAGMYVQDDIRLRKNLTLSAGVRYELQNHVRDDNNVGPRVGLTWAPFKSGRTTLRASAGIFYDWVSASIYQQTQLFNGVQQQELEVVDPVFVPGQVPIGAGTVAPTNAYELAPNLQLQRGQRLSASISQAITQRLSVAATYAHQRIVNQLSGVDLNAAVDGVRPDQTLGDVIAATSEGTTLANSFSSTLTFAPSSPARQNARFNWRRGSATLYYYLAKADTNALGAFVVSPTGTLATEWGPTNNDVRQRVSAYATSTALKNLNATLWLSAATGTPYTETTGLDPNGEFMFNERPSGVGRNTLRTPGQWTLNSYFAYTVAFARRAKVSSGTGSASQNGAAPASAVRMTFSLFAVNLTNHTNYTGFSGVQTSPFFMQPTTAASPRLVTLNVGFSF